jgi:hypothetical protein
VHDFSANVNQATAKGNTPLILAAKDGHEHVVRCLLGECGADVNQATENGFTAVYAAAQKGFMNVMRCLVMEFGADINIATRDGSTPIMTKPAQTPRYRRQSSAPRLTSRKHMEPPPSRLRTWRRARTTLTPDAAARGSRSFTTFYYCSKECQVTHWPAHKAVCKRGAKLAAGKGK